MKDSLRDKKVVVFGGTSGMGIATVLECVNEGLKYNVPTPVNATITSLVSIIEETYERQF